MVETAKQDLVQIQRSLVEILKEQMKQCIRPSRHVQQYYDEYRRHLQSIHVVSYKRELISRVLASDIVYNGDYHTLEQSQKIPVRILQETVVQRPDVILALEMVMAKHQEVLDAYLSGKISERRFLDRLDYKNTWGFDWSHYQPLLQFAKDRGLRVIGLNTRPRSREDRLRRRDLNAAQILARVAVRHPEALIYVVFGDLHISPDHLPAAVDELLRSRGVHRRRLIIYENSETIYWELVDKGLDMLVDVVKIGPEEYCVMNSTPFVKYQSFLNWMDQSPELELSGHPNWEVGPHRTYYEQLRGFVLLVASYLGLELEDTDSFEVWSSSDLTFLHRLERHSGLSKTRIQDIRALMLRNQRFYVDEASIMYLPALSVNYGAELATHFVHSNSAGLLPWPRDLRKRLYIQIMRQAFGYLGSKIVNHKRFCMRQEDFRASVQRLSRLQRLDGEQKQRLRLAKLALRHIRAEKQIRAAASMTALDREMFPHNRILYADLTRYLGYWLGERLFGAMVWGIVDKQEICRMLSVRFRPAVRAYELYGEILRKIEPLREHYRSKADHM